MTVHFAAITDELLGPLPESFGLITDAMTQLKDLLGVDSYNDMGSAEQHREQLDQLEAQLEAHLSLPLVTEAKVAEAPLAVRKAWYGAYLGAWHYVDTVGPAEEILSTVELHTLPHFRTWRCDQATYEHSATRLAELLELDEETITQLKQDHQNGLLRLGHCRQVLDWLRGRVCDQAGKISRELVFNLFSALFPHHQLLADEVDLVLTRTGMYWILIDGNKVPEGRPAAKAWIKQHRRFRFEQFTHFPMFCNFDSRDASPDLITEGCKVLGWDEHQLRFQLDRSMMLETGGDIDKYLIHDSWGHIWQGYLTELTEHYDHLATMQFPINADYHIALPNDDILCLADCLYLRHDGSVTYDEQMATDYINAVLNERMTALLTPITAELTADIFEYCFHADHLGTDITLPSSSLFNHQPTKIDFAWADMQYFARALARPIRQYQKNEQLRQALVQRMCSLLRLKYANNSAAVSDQALFGSVDRLVTRFIDSYVRIQEQHLSTEFTTATSDDGACTTVFARLFANLLRIQFAVNEMYHKHLHDSELMQQRKLINFFIVHYFQDDPAARFWSMDEQLAAWCLPMLKAVQEMESPEKRPIE